MATGPFQLYNKADNRKTYVGQIAAADFSTGVYTLTIPGGPGVKAKACILTMNADPSATTGVQQVTADLNTDGTITINCFTDAHAASGVEVDVSWLAIW